VGFIPWIVGRQGVRRGATLEVAARGIVSSVAPRRARMARHVPWTQVYPHSTAPRWPRRAAFSARVLECGDLSPL